MAQMSWNTPTELVSLIGLQYSDFDGGEDRFQAALDDAYNSIIIRLSEFEENSYKESSTYRPAIFSAASDLRKAAEWRRAAAILYFHKAEIETQYGEAGNIQSTPDGLLQGAFTPNRLEVAGGYKQRANELQQEYEAVMETIGPVSNRPVVSAHGGRSDFTDNGTFFGKDEWT